MTLYLRNSRRLRNVDSGRARVIEGDVLDTNKLKEAMAGQDVVYANLAGDLERQAKSIVKAMKETGVRRLIFISSMGIYDEVPVPPFRGNVVSRKSVAALVVKLAQSPELEVRRSLGVSKGCLEHPRRREGVARLHRRQRVAQPL